MNKNLKTLIYVIVSLILMSFVFGLGFYFGGSKDSGINKITSVINKDQGLGVGTDFGSFWKAWNVLKEKSIYNEKTSDQERVWGAISGLASSLDDPYTVFFPPEENKLFNEEIQGSFGGIGAEIGMKDNFITIISPLKDTPAWNAGLKTGDKILKIDNTNTNELTVDKAISLIRGEKGTTITLTIFRQGEKETREIKIVRDIIDYPTIETELREDGIFVIRFYSFSQNSVSLFKEAVDEFLKVGSGKLILDLRGNPGGYLDAAVKIGSFFIDSGKIIVKEDFQDNSDQKVYRSRGPKLLNGDLKFVVLVDGGSASASEILAGALKEYGVATLVGEQTFGKGSVQELIPITKDTSLKVTVAKWLTPNGISISDQGLTPDVKVSFTPKDIQNKIDVQFEKAVEILQANN